MNTSRFALGSAFVAIIAAVGLSAGTASAQTVPCNQSVAPVGYSQPAFVQPAYAQPAYAQPVYQQAPVYVQPAYAQPVAYPINYYGRGRNFQMEAARIEAARIEAARMAAMSGHRGGMAPVRFERSAGFGWRHGR